jgi:hypothetical protein
MVMCRPVGHAKIDRNRVQERRIGKLHAMASEIVRNEKREAVESAMDSQGAQLRAAAILVCGPFKEDDIALGQVQPHVARWPAARRVKNMGRERHATASLTAGQRPTNSGSL